jgi:S-adenosylmethionine/arginine decarboxylase-like enzyme
MGAAHGGQPSGTVVHLVAEFKGVAESCLRDSTLLGGLLIAAAGAAGLHALTSPLLRNSTTQGVDGLMLLDGGHAAIHAQASRGCLLLDLVAPIPAELTRALDVFTRRLAPTAVSAETLVRASAPE